ncbi:hypothetical protein IFR05_005489 [Cadophora sp. M221]|nr:hypothetical protein IFR05_005489 [Cadophora sp. M221]
MEAHGCQLGQCEDHANQGLDFWEELFPVLQGESGTVLRVREFRVDSVLRKSEDEPVSNSAVKWLRGHYGSVDDAVARLVFWWKIMALYNQFPLLAPGHALVDIEEEKPVAWIHLMEALDKNPRLNLINLAAAHPPAEIKEIISCLRYTSQTL